MYMNQCGTNRFMPHKNQKIKKDLFNLFLGILTIFCSKRGSKRFTAGVTSSARETQFSAANRFMPRFGRYFELNIIHKRIKLRKKKKRKLRGQTSVKKIRKKIGRPKKLPVPLSGLSSITKYFRVV